MAVLQGKNANFHVICDVDSDFSHLIFDISGRKST